MAGMVDGDCSEKLPVCPIIFEWTHVVQDFTAPMVYTTEEKHFFQRVQSAPPLYLIVNPNSLA